MTLTAGNLVLANPMVCANTAKGDNKLYSDAKGVVPSLDLRFASQKNLNDYMTGQDLITFSRPVGANQSPGTYIDENGIIQLSSADTPRFDHDPTTGESLGLLIEESRTNLFDYSTDLTQWSANNSAAPVASSEIAPDGSTDSYRLNVNIGGGSYFTRDVPTVAGSVYTISVWAKNVPGEQNYFDLFFNTAGNVQLGKTALTDTWTRYYITGTATQTGNVLAGINNPPDDYTARGLFWGFQFELGAFPTSYIPTDGAALTRNPDNATITGSDFSSWFNSPEGTLFTDLQTPNTSCFGWNVSDGSNNNRFVFDPGVNTGTAAAIVSGGGPTFGTPPTVLAGGGKIAFAYKPNDYGVYGNQTQLAGTSPAAVPTGLNQIGLGYRGNYAPDAYLNGTIARLTYFPDRLEDSVLQAITQ